ncbi:MAG: anti-sigma factor [Planctomycetota bacterium]|jgi:hypothetical protein
MNENGVTFEQLVAYASGELRGSDVSIVETFLAAVPQAAANTARLRAVIETMQTDDSAPPTAEAIRRALAAWSERGEGRVQEWIQQAQRIVASIVFDNRQHLAVPGFRGGVATQQLAFECPRGRVDLQILPRPRPGGDGWRLRGQVSLPDDPTMGTVALVSSDTEETAATTTPDGHGRFKIDPSPGVYDLLIELDEGRHAIVAPGLAIGTEIE